MPITQEEVGDAVLGPSSLQVFINRNLAPVTHIVRSPGSCPVYHHHRNSYIERCLEAWSACTTDDAGSPRLDTNAGRVSLAATPTTPILYRMELVGGYENGGG